MVIRYNLYPTHQPSLQDQLNFELENRTASMESIINFTWWTEEPKKSKNSKWLEWLEMKILDQT